MLFRPLNKILPSSFKIKLKIVLFPDAFPDTLKPINIYLSTSYGAG
jgi:hypothetical protein